VFEFAVEDVNDHLASVNRREHDESWKRRDERKSFIVARRGRTERWDRFALAGDQIDELQGKKSQARRAHNKNTIRRTYPRYATVTGEISVDKRSKVAAGEHNEDQRKEQRLPTKTMNRIEKQQNPHIWSMKMSSMRLCTVELIHRRRCDIRTFQSSGAIVCAWASRQNFILSPGNRCESGGRLRRIFHVAEDKRLP
jgi:hypothetical protein